MTTESITLTDFPSPRAKTHIGRREDGTVHIRFENPNDERDTYLEAHQLQFVARKAQEIANA